MLFSNLSCLHPSDEHYKKELQNSLSTPSIFCLPDVTTHDQVSQTFPFCILYTASDQTLEAVKAWEYELVILSTSNHDRCSPNTKLRNGVYFIKTVKTCA